MSALDILSPIQYISKFIIYEIKVPIINANSGAGKLEKNLIFCLILGHKIITDKHGIATYNALKSIFQNYLKYYNYYSNPKKALIWLKIISVPIPHMNPATTEYE